MLALRLPPAGAEDVLAMTPQPTWRQRAESTREISADVLKRPRLGASNGKRRLLSCGCVNPDFYRSVISICDELLKRLEGVE